MQLNANRLARLGLCCALTSLCFTSTGCQKVIPPAHDSMSPTLSWGIAVHDAQEGWWTKNLAGVAADTAHLGQRYTIGLHANNPGGVQSIAIAPAYMTWACRLKDGSALTRSADLNPFTQPDVAPNSDGSVLTELILIYPVDVRFTTDTMWCLKTETFIAGNVKIDGSATNYNKPNPHLSQAHLYIHIDP